MPEGWAMRDPATDPAFLELGTIRFIAKVRCSAMVSINWYYIR